MVIARRNSQKLANLVLHLMCQKYLKPKQKSLKNKIFKSCNCSCMQRFEPRTVTGSELLSYLAFLHMHDRIWIQ